MKSLIFLLIFCAFPLQAEQDKFKDKQNISYPEIEELLKTGRYEEAAGF